MPPLHRLLQLVVCHLVVRQRAVEILHELFVAATWRQLRKHRAVSAPSTSSPGTLVSLLPPSRCWSPRRPSSRPPSWGANGGQMWRSCCRLGGRMLVDGIRVRSRCKRGEIFGPYHLQQEVDGRGIVRQRIRRPGHFNEGLDDRWFEVRHLPPSGLHLQVDWISVKLSENYYLHIVIKFVNLSLKTVLQIAHTYFTAWQSPSAASRPADVFPFLSHHAKFTPHGVCCDSPQDDPRQQSNN